MRKKGIPVMNVGISLIILIFMNLCLVTFSVLSLENAVSDQRLSKKTADHTTAYYTAVNQIQEARSKDEEALGRLWTSRTGNQDYYNKIKKKYKGTEGFVENTDGTFLLKLTKKVSDMQMLHVTLRLGAPKDGRYTSIESWQLKAEGSWTPDQSLDVYKGE